MPRQFKNDEVELLFPENWLLSESYQETDGIDFQVMLEHPDGAFWLLSACRSEPDAQLLVDELKRQIAEQYETVEWIEASDTILQQPMLGLDGMFFSLDLLIAAEIRTFTRRNRTFVILAQGESREFDQLRLVFQAIATSMLQASVSPLR
jgi:hypothetical protein